MRYMPNILCTKACIRYLAWKDIVDYTRLTEKLTLTITSPLFLLREWPNEHTCKLLLGHKLLWPKCLMLYEKCYFPCNCCVTGVAREKLDSCPSSFEEPSPEAKSNHIHQEILTGSLATFSISINRKLSSSK